MKKSIYFRNTVARPNKIKAAIFQFFYGICSAPRMLLELFIRYNFGERYFSLPLVIFLFILLFFAPLVADDMSGHYDIQNAFVRHFGWYTYTAAFLYLGVKRYKEIKRKPGVFDFSRYSLSNGELNPRFGLFCDNAWHRVFRKMPTLRQYEILIEPLPFLLAGLLCYSFDPMFGGLLAVCATIYSLSFSAAYWIGDNIIMDLIDDHIMAEQTRRILVEDKGPRETKGTAIRGKKPTAHAQREQLSDLLLTSDEPAAAVI